jgi:ketosteroid isomerase-like protein
MVTRAAAERILDTYKRAWEEQDVSLILSIFTKDGVYHERALWPKYRYVGHKGIAEYWRTKVVGEQSNIRFKLRKFWVSGDTIIAEWDAWFYTKEVKANMHLREVAIMELKGNKIKNYREFWHSQTTKSKRTKS